MLCSDNFQQLIIMNVSKDCKINHNNDFAHIRANSADTANDIHASITISIHKDALIELFGELCRPYIQEDLAIQAKRGKRYRVIKVSTDQDKGRGSQNVPEIIRDVIAHHFNCNLP